MRHLAVMAIGLALSAPAFAQDVEPPRFEAFEQQKADLQQQQFNDLTRARQDEITRPIAPAPNASYTFGEQQRRVQEIDRQMDTLRLDNELERQAIGRERDIAEANLLNRRIIPSSPLVVKEPGQFALPPPPNGQYYARVEGRYVLVDGKSNLVVKQFERKAGDPTNDIPAGAPPVPQSEVAIGAPARTQHSSYGGANLPPQPALPGYYVGPDSALVVKVPGMLKLGPAPENTYYAEIGGKIYLVDATTRHVIALVRTREKQP
jgi:Ni/Co efflux regulator RcnB